MAAGTSDKAPFVDRYRPWLYALAKFFLLAFYRVVYRMRVVGLERVPREGPMLVASNHASHLDPPAVGISMPRPVRIMAKKELFSVPVLGWLISGLGAIPVSRGGADRRAVETMGGLLRTGATVLIFPEGTRTLDGRLQEPKAGVGWLALQMPDCWIVPVYVTGTYAAWPKGRRFPRPGRITIHVGDPFRTSAALESIRSRAGEGSTPADSTTGMGAEPGEENQGLGAKKRLYWALAEEIMASIATVQRGTSR